MKIDSRRITPKWLFSLPKSQVAVGGSNLAGRHGAGFARIAVEKFGAIPGQASGPQGQTYMIPTKDGRPVYDPKVRKTLPLRQIRPYVEEFFRYARRNPALTFQVTEIGTGLAGYTPAQVAPLFSEALQVPNVNLPESFWEWIIFNNDKKQTA